MVLFHHFAFIGASDVISSVMSVHGRLFHPISPTTLTGAIGRSFSTVYTGHALNPHGDSRHAYLTPIIHWPTHGESMVTPYTSLPVRRAGSHLESVPSHLDWLFREQQCWNKMTVPIATSRLNYVVCHC